MFDTFNVFFTDPALVATIHALGARMSNELDAVKAALQANTDATNAFASEATVLIQEFADLKTKIDALAAGNGDTAELPAIAAAMGANTQRLADAAAALQAAGDAAAKPTDSTPPPVVVEPPVTGDPAPAAA
jgi:uncharacterized phage infection (PIP) family protein YhgE